MAEWWQELQGATNSSLGWLANNNPGNIDKFAGNALNKWGKSDAGSAALSSGLSPSALQDIVSTIASNPAKAGATLAGTVGVDAAGLMLTPKPVTAEPTPEQQALLEEEFPSPPTPPKQPLDEILNEGYPGKTVAKLGSLIFEVPPAMSTVTSVHGGMGTVAPGAGSGISVKHVQNFSTMLIPGTVPLYQSLGIQGQVVEFVGAFLGFSTSAQHDASKHMDPDQSGSNITREDSPDPFYLTDKFPYDNGRPYGQGNIGSWAVSRAFELAIRKGEPLTLEITTGVVQILYSVIVSGFDRMYQRDDRTWYKIQALVVGSAEFRRAGGGKEQEPKKSAAKKPSKAPPKGKAKAAAKKKAKTKNTAAGKTGTKAAAARPAQAEVSWLKGAEARQKALENNYINSVDSLIKTFKVKPVKVKTASKEAREKFVRATQVFISEMSVLAKEAINKNLRQEFVVRYLIAKVVYEEQWEKFYKQTLRVLDLGVPDKSLPIEWPKMPESPK